MAEPEELLIDAARHATVFATRLWQRGESSRSPVPTLDLYRPRLELLLDAAYGVPIRVRTAQPPLPRTALARLFRRIPRDLIEPYALPAHDGSQIFLPQQLIVAPVDASAIFRTLALQQAGRALRTTRAPPINNALLCDLYGLSEAVAVDYASTRDFPGFTPTLCQLRKMAMQNRPPTGALNLIEEAVEQIYQQVLQTPPSKIPSSLVLAANSAESLDWAQATAQRINAQDIGNTGKSGIPYRGLRKGLWLGLVHAQTGRQQLQSGGEVETDAQKPPQRQGQMQRRPEVREAADDEDDDPNQGMWMLQMDDPQQHVEDPMGLQRPTDRDDNADAGDLADSLSELPEARLISSPRPAPEVLVSDDPLDRRAVLPQSTTTCGTGISYPEWDYRIASYRPRAALVRTQIAPSGAADWAAATLLKHRALLRLIQRRFEGLRPRRHRQDRQADGDDVDLNAYVNSYAERCAGLPLQQRWYQSVRPARRDIAIALLIDISGSTDGWVKQDLRIIDVEKEALLLVYHALLTLGDPFCIQAFSGEGPDNVALWSIKEFEDKPSAVIESRIAALEPQRYTRAGAAIRHTTTLLSACAAEHRLLLMLSDGKPNDVDQYEGRYGVEDMRQAVAEAGLQSIHTFCLTVDRHAPRYLASVFGPYRYAVLQHAERLPVVLIEILRSLIKT